MKSIAALFILVLSLSSLPASAGTLKCKMFGGYAWLAPLIIGTRIIRAGGYCRDQYDGSLFLVAYAKGSMIVGEGAAAGINKTTKYINYDETKKYIEYIIETKDDRSWGVAFLYAHEENGENDQSLGIGVGGYLSKLNPNDTAPSIQEYLLIRINKGTAAP